MKYQDIGFEKISLIKNVWEKNRDYHRDISEHFSNDYVGLHFEERMQFLGDIDKENVKITIAEKNNEVFGYCISCCEAHKGELLSLHVLESERSKGIGKELSKTHLDWLKSKKCSEIQVVVSQENNNTIRFYKDLGFLANTIQMKLK